MDFNTLRDNLQLPYQQKNWKEWLLQLFGQQISIETQAEKITVQKGNSKSIERFASIALSDDKNIAVLDIKTTKEIQIARNRVALREIVFKLIDQDKYHGLIVFYHSEDVTQLDYRLSFISSQTSIDEEGIITTQSTNSKRYSFILGANESCNTATNRLLDLKNRIPKFKAFEFQKGISLKDVTDTFSVEALNNEFFKKYKDIHYKRFWEFIANNDAYSNLLLNKDEQDISKQQKPIRDFVKKMLGRIVFLHFLQKKGWLGVPLDNHRQSFNQTNHSSDNWSGGDKMYMLNLFENSTDKENFYSKILTELFYETLNKKRKGDIAANVLTPSTLQKVGVRLPFLNGGLFDDDAPQTNTFNFPIEYFKDLFDFFSQYNFTIDENSPEEQEVGIDPEMLGHIFENLLEENKDKGAFYTPKEIVHYMCQESLIQYLRTHLPECTEDESQATKAIEIFIRKDTIGDRADKKNYIVANAKRIAAILDKVKICDPAIGSGAFPMGMLQEIFKAKTTLDLTLDKAQVKKEIIQNSIYGVDIEKGAVDIARLRFWLSLIVDEDEPQPLPNLDYKIMQGNSLLESFEEVDLSNLLHEENDEPIIYAKNEQVKLFEEVKQSLMMFDKVTKDELQALINLYFDFEERNKTKYKNKLAVKQAINTIIEGKLKAHFFIEKKKYEKQKAETEIGILANTITPKDPKGIVEKKQKNIALVTKKLDAIDYKINHLSDILHKLHKWENEDKERPYFLWHTYFKDVFDKGGFDIVIGNPPYVRQEMLGKEKKDLYAVHFTDVYNSIADLYVYFYSLSIKLSKPKGTISLITPNKWMERSYGVELRNKLKSLSLKLIVNYGELQVFQEAATEPMVILFSNEVSNNDIKYAIIKTQTQIIDTFNYPFFRYSKENLSSDIWRFTNNKTNSILKRIQNNSISLNEYTKGGVYRGILTGLNNAFIISKDIRDKIVRKDANSNEIIKPMVEGKDFNKYEITYKRRFMIATQYDLNVPEKYPAVYEYLLQFEQQLQKRDDKGKNWWNLRACDYYNEISKDKIIYYHTAKNHNFYFDTEGYYISANCYFISNADTYLQSILNSKFFGFIKLYLFPAFGDAENGGRIRLDANKMIKVPIAKTSSENKQLVESLTYKILSLNSTNNSSIYYENKIDALVFHLYGLTEVEMNQVLDTFKDLSIKDRNQIQNEYWNIANKKFKLEI